MLNVVRPLLILAALFLVAPAHAQDPPADPAAEPRSQREDAGQRVRQVERDGGRVLQAEPMQRGGRETYRIKVLTPEGRVRVLDEGRGRDSRQLRDDGPPPVRPGRPAAGRDDRLESARQSPMLRDRPRQSAPPDDRRSAPPTDAGEPARRGDGGRSRD